MAKTSLDIFAGIRTYLDEAAPLDWTGPEVVYAANYAYQDVIGKVMEVYERYYETTTPFTYAVVANQQEYAIDPSIIKTTRVEINYSPTSIGSIPSRAVRIDMDEILTRLADSTTSGNLTNPGYYLHGSQDSQMIGFTPIPQASDTGNNKSISVWGIATPPLLQDAVTTNILIPFPDRFSWLIEIKAAADLLRKGQQQEAVAAEYIQTYDRKIIEMQTFLKERQSEGAWMIEDTAMEDIDFEVMSPW